MGSRRVIQAELGWLTVYASLLWAGASSAAEFQLSGPEVQAHGVLRYALRSLYQSSPTTLRILRPAVPPAGEPARVVFVLPVEAGTSHSYGDPVEVARLGGYHDRYNLTVVEPTFSQVPWYGNHWGNSGARQESYIVYDVVQAVERLFPETTGRRLLLGFSKSGWGALSLILRHSDLFAGAACFDAPLHQTSIEASWGMDQVFSTQANLNQYLLGPEIWRHAGEFRTISRLWLGGYSSFAADMDWGSAALRANGIPHMYDRRDYGIPAVGHSWGSGWFGPALRFLASVPVPTTNGPALVFANRTFHETRLNNGAISNVVLAHLRNERFAVQNQRLQPGTHYLATNVPAGLKLEVEGVDATTLRIALAGQALAHSPADVQKNLVVQFLDAAFESGPATSVWNHVKSHGVVDFDEPAPPGFEIAARYDFTGTQRTSSDHDIESTAGDVLDGGGLAGGSGMNVTLGKPAPSFLARSSHTRESQATEVQGNVYFEFTVRSATNKLLDLEGGVLSFDLSPNDPGLVCGWAVRSSLDGFTSTLGQGTETGRSNVFERREVLLEGNPFRGVPAVTFRFYVFDNASHPNLALRFDNIILTRHLRPAPVLAIALTPEGKVQLSWQGISGRSYSVHRTSDFVQWPQLPIATGVTCNSGGLALHEDPSPTPAAFYRVVEEQIR